MGLRDKAKKALEDKDLLVSEDAAPVDTSPQETEDAQDAQIEETAPEVDISSSIIIEEPPKPKEKTADISDEKPAEIDEFQKSIEKMKALGSAEKDLKKKLADAEKERDANSARIGELEAQLKILDKKLKESEALAIKLSELEQKLGDSESAGKEAAQLQKKLASLEKDVDSRKEIESELKAKQKVLEK